MLEKILKISGNRVKIKFKLGLYAPTLLQNTTPYNLRPLFLKAN